MRTNSRETGVYAIHCKVNDFVYIGSTANKRGFRNRCWTHRCLLKKGTHHSPILQRHYNKYGEDAFEFHILEHCSPEECLDREQMWLDIRGIGYPNKSYNVSPVAGSQLGCKRSKETCEKIGRTKRGNKYCLGLKRSEAERARISALHKGRKHTPEARAKISLAGMGKVQSLETRLKRAQHRKQNPLSAEVMQRIAQELADANSKDYIVTTPDGSEINVRNLSKFCREHGLTTTQMSNAARGKVVGHKGYKCRYAHTTKEEQEATIRQIKAGWDLKTYVVISPDLKVFQTENLTAFCRDHNLESSGMTAVGRAEMRSYRGWRCYLLNEPEELAAKRKALSGKADRYIATSPDGLVFGVIHLPLFCKDHGLDPSSMTKVTLGKKSHHKGWKCVKVTDKETARSEELSGNAIARLC